MFRLIGVKLPNNSAAQANEATTIATHTHTNTATVSGKSGKHIVKGARMWINIEAR